VLAFRQLYMVAILPFIFFLCTARTVSGSKDVYICDNKKTKKYHLSDKCRGLSNCQFKIVKSDERSSIVKGMTLCLWEVEGRH
jgi:hypothetical protein